MSQDRNFHFHGDVSPRIADSDILEPAQMVHIDGIRQVVRDQADPRDATCAGMDVRRGGNAQERIGRGRRFRTGQEMVLGEMVIDPEGNITVPEGLSVMEELPFDFSAQPGSRNERHVLLSEGSADIGKLTAQMEPVDRVDVDGSLAPVQEGLSGSILVNVEAVDGRSGTAGIDIVVDPVAEQGADQGQVFRGEITAQVALEAEFGLEVGIALLVPDRPFVDAVGGEFAEVRRPEAPGDVGPEVQTGEGGIDHAGAGRHARKLAGEILEPVLECEAVEDPEVAADTAGEMDLVQRFGGGGEHARIEQPVGRDEDLFAQVPALLEHAADAGGKFPAVPVAGDVLDVVIDGLQFEIQFGFVRFFLEFLPTVLLVAHQRLDPPVTGDERVVQDGFIMPHLLEGEFQSVPRGAFQNAVLVAFRHARGQVKITQCQAGETPFPVEAHSSGDGPFPELGAGNQTVRRIAVGMGIFVTETDVPDDAALVAPMVQAVGDQAAVALILTADSSRECPGSRVGFGVEDEDAGQGVGTVHEAGRTLDDFGGMDAVSVQFHAVFVTPLLAFLAETVGNDDDPVVAEAADDGFGDAAAGGDLAYAGLPGNGVYDVAGGVGTDGSGIQHADGCGGFTEFAVAGQAGDHHLFQVEMARKYIGRILRPCGYGCAARQGDCI